MSEDTIEKTLAQKDEILAPCDPRHYRVLKRMAANGKNHLALAFGGGSVPALAGNCAFAAMMEELGILEHTREIWGTSAGSIVGAALASGLPTSETLDAIESLKDVKSVDIAWWSLLRGFFTRKLPDGLVRGRHFRAALAKAIPAERIEDCRIPYRAIATTDDGHARRVIIREGPLVDSLMASMCIPGVSWPVVRGGRGFFDGGLAEKTPLLSIIEEHKRQGRDTQLVILASHYDDRARAKRPHGFLQRLVSTFSNLEETIWHYQVKEARDTDAKFVMLNPQMKYGGRYEFEMVRANYLWCRKRFKQQLSNAGLAARFGGI